MELVRKRSKLDRYFSEITEEPKLVFACRLHPPLDVIALPSTLQQDIIHFADWQCRCALHYACRRSLSRSRQVSAQQGAITSSQVGRQR